MAPDGDGDVCAVDYVPLTPYAMRGVPLIRSPETIVETVCNFAKVGPDDIVCEVGCGLGALSIAAAKRGARAIGFDIRQDYIDQAARKAKKAGVEEACEFRICDFSRPDFAIPDEATVAYLYLLPWAVEYLEQNISEFLSRTSCRVVTFQFHFPNLNPDALYLFGVLKMYRAPTHLQPLQTKFCPPDTSDCEVEGGEDEGQGEGNQASETTDGPLDSWAEGEPGEPERIASDTAESFLESLD